jgi:signal transduction histidine kinase
MFQFVNLSIRNKILFIAIVGGLGLSINIFYTHTVVKENSSRLKNIKNIYFPIIEKADASTTYLDKINHLFSESITSGETIFIESAEIAKNEMHHTLMGIAVISPEKKVPMLKLIDEFDLYYAANKKLSEGIISGKLQSIALKNAVDKRNVFFKKFESSLMNFRDSNFNKFSSILEETDLAAQESLDVGIIIFIIVGWLLMFSTLAVITTLTDSFNNVINSLKNMAKGKVDKNLLTQPHEHDNVHVPEELLRVKKALDSVTKRFVETEKEVLNLNLSLQDKVDDATSQLLSVNKKLEEAVIAANNANQAKSTFLANMSHELRTPMNAIIGYGELIEEDIKKQEYQNMVSDIEKVRIASNHLLSLISDILDLSKIEAGKMNFTPVPFNLVQLTDEIEATIKPLAMNENNTYTVDIQTNSTEMFTDLTKLKQILLNLISNACKFTKEGEIKLTITSHHKNRVEYIQFEVSDTGIGIPDDKIATLFDSFTQVDSTTTKKFGGTGLGLAISRRYAQTMGGDIQAESKKNIGSKFILTMPLRFADELAS